MIVFLTPCLQIKDCQQKHMLDDEQHIQRTTRLLLLFDNNVLFHDHHIGGQHEISQFYNNEITLPRTEPLSPHNSTSRSKDKEKMLKRKESADMSSNKPKKQQYQFHYKNPECKYNA